MTSPATTSSDVTKRTSGYDFRDVVSVTRNFTQDFTKIVKLGQPLSPLGYSRTVSHTMCKVSDITIGGTVIGQQSLLGVDGTPDASTTSLTSVVSSRLAQGFYAKAKGLKSNIGVSVAEAPKTIELIADRARRIALAFKALKHFQVGKAFSLLRMRRNAHMTKLARQARSKRRRSVSGSKWAARSWLEIQYGWKPLLGEVYSAAEDLASKHKKVSPDIFVSYSVKERRAVTTFSGGTPSYINTSLKKMQSGGYVEIRSRIQCNFRVVEQSKRTASALGLTNVAAIAWELLPWSFVVDWFAPVGDFLSSLTALSGLQFISGFQTTRTEVKRGYTYGPNGRASAHVPQRFFKGIVTWEEKSFSFSRAILSGPPSVGSILRINGIDKAFSVVHCTNALALMRQVFGR